MWQQKKGSVRGLAWLWCAAMGAGCGAGKDSGLPEGMGAVSFWTDRAECGGLPHDFCVEVEGESASGCASAQDEAPPCGDPDAAASFTLKEGESDFDASVVSGDLTGDWEGTVTIVAGTCQLVQLECV